MRNSQDPSDAREFTEQNQKRMFLLPPSHAHAVASLRLRGRGVWIAGTGLRVLRLRLRHYARCVTCLWLPLSPRALFGFSADQRRISLC